MKNIIFLIILLPFSILGQVNYDTIPINKQVIGRDLSTNLGEVIINGQVDNTGTPYDSIIVDVYRDQVYNNTLSQAQALIYSNNLAPFNFSIDIPAELNNYSFEIYGKIGSNQPIFEKSIDSIVAGDVYIIQGQSNAEARFYDGNANGNVSEFIRVYGGGVADNRVFDPDYNKWYEGDGNVPARKPANTGQWGLKLARMIMDSEQIPIAIFNGATPGQPISYFLENAVPQGTLNNYERLLYRLNKTNLKDHVKAIFWSQGENEVQLSTSTVEYIDYFNNLKSSWMTDYPSVGKFYIFQTKSACDDDDDNIMKIKEAQRQLAKGDNKIHIMQTAALTYADPIVFEGITYDCHFIFTGGYEEFAKRIYELVKRDFYDGSNLLDIETPMILDAYLTDVTTLVIETDASGLKMNNMVENFRLENAGSVTIQDIQVSLTSGNIILTLSDFPGIDPNLSITHLGFSKSIINNDLFITNDRNIELVSFNKYPITLNTTVWDGNIWSHNEPTLNMNAIIDGNYNATNGNIEAKNLIINSNLNFDTSSLSSVIVHGDLTINEPAIFVLGDSESLVMYKNDAIIIGNISKKENSTSRIDVHDITYWSSPVEDELIENVFSNVTSSRIFYFDQSKSSASDPNNDPSGTYWDTWVNIQSGLMTPGFGFAAEGESGKIGVDSREFVGIPNNGDINYTLIGNFGDGDSDNDFNLIGNPYPSAIDMDVFLSENSSVIDPTVYLWTHNTPVSGGDFVNSDYATYNYSGGVGSGSGTNSNGTIIPNNNFGSSQGFFVRAINSGIVVFKNTMRLKDANDQFFKTYTSKNTDQVSEKRDRIWLDLITDQGGFSQLLIGFTDNATEDEDRGYDASRLDGGNPVSFYSQINNNKYVIQGLPSFNYDRTLILGFDTKVAPRIFTIKIDRTEGLLINSEVYLVDNLLNIFHDLKSSDYQFVQTVTGEFPNRFTIQFNGTTLDVDQFNNDNSLTISNTYDGFIINASNVVANIKIYDMLGKLLLQNNPNKQSFDLRTEKIKKGTVLIIKATLVNGVVLNKKAIIY